MQLQAVQTTLSYRNPSTCFSLFLLLPVFMAKPINDSAQFELVADGEKNPLSILTDCRTRVQSRISSLLYGTCQRQKPVCFIMGKQHSHTYYVSLCMYIYRIQQSKKKIVLNITKSTCLVRCHIIPSRSKKILIICIRS